LPVLGVYQNSLKLMKKTVAPIPALTVLASRTLRIYCGFEFDLTLLFTKVDS
jgi:hypothetical protein